MKELFRILIKVFETEQTEWKKWFNKKNKNHGFKKSPSIISNFTPVSVEDMCELASSDTI